MNYQNGKIYSIRSFQTDKVYYGSTTQRVSRRLSVHKANRRSYLQGKKNYVTSFEIVKYDDCYIELVENYPCKSRNELFKREGEIIRANKNDAINKNIAGRSDKQYREDTKEHIQKREGKITICDCGVKHRHHDKARHSRKAFFV